MLGHLFCVEMLFFLADCGMTPQPRPNGAHKSAYAAGKTIQCLIDKLLRNLSETAIASCNATQVQCFSSVCVCVCFFKEKQANKPKYLASWSPIVEKLSMFMVFMASISKHGVYKRVFKVPTT